MAIVVPEGTQKFSGTVVIPVVLVFVKGGKFLSIVIAEAVSCGKHTWETINIWIKKQLKEPSMMKTENYKKYKNTYKSWNKCNFMTKKQL